MSKSLRKAAWKLPRETGLRATAPLSLHNKGSPAPAAHDDTKKPSASRMPTCPAATGAVCKNSVPSRSDVWREPRSLTGTRGDLCTDLCIHTCAPSRSVSPPAGVLLPQCIWQFGLWGEELGGRGRGKYFLFILNKYTLEAS